MLWVKPQLVKTSLQAAVMTGKLEQISTMKMVRTLDHSTSTFFESYADCLTSFEELKIGSIGCALGEW